MVVCFIYIYILYAIGQRVITSTKPVLSTETVQTISSSKSICSSIQPYEWLSDNNGVHFDKFNDSVNTNELLQVLIGIIMRKMSSKLFDM